ncbi:hypothetical protein [Paraburkholderia elongata]|uniref:Uncharacterized protein n=1 Tax=Paraburkholderia elongata TaxID=2675747 RepID=A0A972NJC1_9BURK|nr:hypothetical protein [Paraburkholderia elongata]NPT54441.1 hypothetical protein [Paraburkholderia elongata]
MLSSQVKKHIDNKNRLYCLQKVRNLNVEYLLAYDLVDGKTIGESIGSANTVPIPQAVTSAGADATRKIKVIHVHPKSVSFSSTDILVMLANPGFAELEAIGPDGSIFWGQIEALPQNFGAANFFVTRSEQAYLRALQRNGFPKKQQPATFLALEFAHIICTALAQVGVLGYQSNLPTTRMSGMALHAKLFADMVNETVNQLTDLRW